MALTSGFPDADKYASYLATPAGRLRVELAWDTVRRFLPPDTSGRRALDLGGGTGSTSAQLAALGFQVVLLDASEPMIATARQQAAAGGLSGRISFRRAEAGQLCDLFAPGSFDVVICHNLLEYVPEPSTIVHGIARVLCRGGLLSVLVRNRAGEVLRAAIRAGDCKLAAGSLSAETVVESLFGTSVRLFTPGDLRAIIESAGLDAIAERGVRVFFDYLARQDVTDDEWRDLFELETTLAALPQFAAVARYTQMIARAPAAALA